MCAFKLCSGKAVARYSAGFGAITHTYIYIFTHTHNCSFGFFGERPVDVVTWSNLSWFCMLFVMA